MPPLTKSCFVTIGYYDLYHANVGSGRVYFNCEHADYFRLKYSMKYFLALNNGDESVFYLAKHIAVL